MNSLAELKSFRIRSHNNVIFLYLNINSTRNKFDNLKLIIDEHVDILFLCHLPSPRLTSCTAPKDIQIIPFELNLRKEKWMFMYIYRPPAQDKQYFSENLSKIVDHYASI